ncbi:MAG: hypothetical protein EPN93_07485 [Spirochaetes bacterium]|nr:MAG: hypothetical protein EPN93_07485 [Spirochaetota bacterium]
MNKPARVLALAILAVQCACGTGAHTARPDDSGSGDPLRDFFALCEQDMAHATAVIEKRALIDNLTHLQKMNEGGDRFYLLEREGITEMIRAVTQGNYSDFILINAHGMVVYTRDNDDLFAKNIRHFKPESPLGRCFSNRKTPLHVEDVTEFPRSSGLFRMLIAGNVFQGGEIKGVFILQVDMERLLGVAGADTTIASADGIVRVDSRKELVLNPLITDDRASPEALCTHGSILQAGKSRRCRIFSYDSLRWTVIAAP